MEFTGTAPTRSIAQSPKANETLVGFSRGCLNLSKPHFRTEPSLLTGYTHLLGFPLSAYPWGTATLNS